MKRRWEKQVATAMVAILCSIQPLGSIRTLAAVDPIPAMSSVTGTPSNSFAVNENYLENSDQEDTEGDERLDYFDEELESDEETDFEEEKNSDLVNEATASNAALAKEVTGVANIEYMPDGQTIFFLDKGSVSITRAMFDGSDVRGYDRDGNLITEANNNGYYITVSDQEADLSGKRIEVWDGSSGGSGGSKGVVSTGGPVGASPLPAYVVKGTWAEAQNGSWRFTDVNGNLYKDCWAAVYNPYANTAIGQSAFDWFYFDTNGDMLTGWYLDAEGNSYYLNPVSDGTKGKMLTGWVWIADADGIQKCYYFNTVSDGYRGKMMRDMVVDGYMINGDGHWVENGVIQIR